MCAFIAALIPTLSNWPNTPIVIQLGLTEGPIVSVQPDRLIASLVGQLVVAFSYPNIHSTQGMIAFGLYGLAQGKVLTSTFPHEELAPVAPTSPTHTLHQQAEVAGGSLTGKFTSIDCQYKMIVRSLFRTSLGGVCSLTTSSSLSRSTTWLVALAWISSTG
jgi:hypothetical protein